VLEFTRNGWINWGSTDLGVVLVVLDPCRGARDLDHDGGHGHLDLELDDVGHRVELHVHERGWKRHETW
jgi:hypothetical protein